MERYKFYQAHQAQTESIADFTARLKRLSTNCNFADIETALRDQLVCGLKDHATRATLFREEKLTYDREYKISTTLEIAEENALSIDRWREEDLKSDVNWVQSKQRMPSNQSYRGTSRGGSVTQRGYKAGQGPSNRVAAQSTWKLSVNTDTRGTDNRTCYCCGKPNHWARDCYHRFNTCSVCKKRGHFSTVCRGQKTVNRIDEGELETESQQREDSTDDFFMVRESENTQGAETTLGAVQTISSGVRADPMYLNVVIEGISVKMEIDTGSCTMCNDLSARGPYAKTAKGRCVVADRPPSALTC
ncbi:uncharacterized protein LOC122403765 [Colletes gigas]|uniref:uncharacterized protein LOC122403765 n=1 Tax=Colletes gigas TaxID=935657 RepID=UPI001C9A38AB|nr:uncharacterized protein LOC122403765 [Colletes gigas]